MKNQAYYKTEASVNEYIQMAAEVDSLKLIKKLDAYLDKDALLLELGSGPGTDWNFLNEKYQVTGSDFSEVFLKHLINHNPEGQFLLLDAISIETEQKFDAIYSNKVLHHLKDEELFASMKRQLDTLNPRGIICHSFWKGEGSEDFKGMFVNYHTEKALRHLFEPEFEILQVEEYQEFEANDSIVLIARRK